MDALALVLASSFALQSGGPAINSLDAASGWRAIFDGKTTKGWTTDGTEWSVKDGELTPPATKREILSLERQTRDAEFELTWIDTAEAGEVRAQLLSTEGWSVTWRKLGAREEVFASVRDGHFDKVTPASSVTHQNDQVELTAGPTPGAPAVAQWTFGLVPGSCRFSTVRLRERETMPGDEVELFDGKSTSGWRLCGDASYTADDNSILGHVTKGAHSFLVTEKEFGDFVFDVDVKNEEPGNSGIQIRSHQDASGKVFGYQIEIDPSKRAWSGGLYDEGRRAWLQDLSKNELARSAFTSGEWNHYHIECLGPWIRAWVNGIATADYFDPLDLSGFIGLQVHAGNDTRVRWKDFRMRDLGVRSWESASADRLFGPIDATHHRNCGSPLDDFGLRIKLHPNGGGHLHFRSEGDAPEKGETAQVVGPALRRTSSSWFVDLGDPAIVGDDSKAERTIAILAYGSRVALFVDGKSLVQVDAPDARLHGCFALKDPNGEAATIGDCALIGEPKR